MRKTIIPYLKRILKIDESRKMSEEERTVKNLETYFRQRNKRIVAFSFLLVMMIAISIYTFWREYEHNKMMAPFHIRRMATFENPKQDLPILLSRFYVIAGYKAKLTTYKLYFGLFTGVIIAMLINEFAGFTRNKHKLTLSMWHTIKQMESEVKELKARTPMDDEQFDEIDRADKSR